jgi:hypothetical protein
MYDNNMYTICRYIHLHIVSFVFRDHRLILVRNVVLGFIEDVFFFLGCHLMILCRVNPKLGGYWSSTTLLAY